MGERTLPQGAVARCRRLGRGTGRGSDGQRADAVPINRVPWVAMGRKLKQLAVLPKENNCQSSTEKAAPVGMAIDKKPAGLPAMDARGRKEIEPQLKKDEARVIDTMK